MSTLRIYADFNELVSSPRNPNRTAVVLDTWGSLRDLCNAGVVLSEGLPLIAVDWSDEQEDLEGHGVATYDRLRKWWVVEFDEQGVRYVPAGDRRTVIEFRCVECRADLEGLLGKNGLPGQGNVTSFDGSCPSCGTPILAPFNPPDGTRAR